MTGHRPSSAKASTSVAVRPTDGSGPVFIYSGFRTSSSWFWKKFRKDPLACAYYEPFNQILADLKTDSILSVRADSWRSHHPVEAGYLAEYGALLGQAPGVPLFPKGDQDSDRFVGSAGVEGPLDADIAAYVANLVEIAQRRRRIPVLACTRMLGRAAGLRTSFGGFHILLVRNLYQQWVSFSGQARFGNYGFLQILLKTTHISQNDEFVSFISNLFTEEERSDFIKWHTKDNNEKIFCYFVVFHLYFLMIVRRHVDLVVDVNQLVRQGSSYQAEVSRVVAAQTGLQIDLGDARESVDYPIYPLSSVADCQVLLRTMVDRLILSEARDDEDRRFVEALIADLWDEHARFTVATSGAAEVIAGEAAKAQEESRRRAEAEALNVQTSAALAELQQETEARIERLKADAEHALAQSQAAAADRSSRLETALQQAVLLERELADKAQAHAAAVAEVEAAAAEASHRLQAETRQVVELEQQNAEQVRNHAAALASAHDRIAAVEMTLAGSNDRLAALWQDHISLARENGRLEGQLAAQIEENAARLADSAAVRHDLADRLSRAEQVLAIANSEAVRLRTELAEQARVHDTALAAANARQAEQAREHEAALVAANIRQAQQAAALLTAANEADRLAQTAAGLSQQLADSADQNSALTAQIADLISQRDGIVAQFEAAQRQADQQMQALHNGLAQLRGHISWRELQLQQAVELLAAIPDPLAGLPRLLAALVRRVAGAARLATIADHRAAAAQWQSATMLTATPEVSQGEILSLAGNLGVADTAFMHGGFGMVESDGPITSVPRLLAPHDRHFIHTAYQAVLGRAPDAEGGAYYLARLRAGVHKLAILRQLRQSPEGRAFTPGVAGLDRAIRRYSWATMPLVGGVVRQFTGAEGNSATHRRLRILANEIGCIRVEQSALAGAVRRLAAHIENSRSEAAVHSTAEANDVSFVSAGVSPQVNTQQQQAAFGIRQGLAGFFQTRIWSR